MTREEFRDAVHKGLGRAILFARANDVSEFRDIILDACLHNLAIDPICEGTHGEYTLNLIEKLPDRGFYVDAILKALPLDPETWHAKHRYYLAMNFALDGSDSAKRSMYDAYAPGPSFGEGIGNHFIQMDGLSGFLFAAEKLGALLLSGCEDYDYGWLMSTAEEELGEEVAWNALREASGENQPIAAYLKRAESERLPGPDTRDALLEMSYAELKPELTLRKWAHLLGAWGECCSDADFELAVQGLLSVTDPDEQAAHLKIFHKAKFPLGHGPLLPLAASPSPKVAYCALMALARLTHPTIRQLAFDLVQNRSAYREEAIGLLHRNFEPGDHALALRWFESEDAPEIIHGLSGDLRQLWKYHPEPDTETSMLLSIYEHDHCSHNREFIVRRLLELDAVTDAIRVECVWDANNEIRNLFKA